MENQLHYYAAKHNPEPTSDTGRDRNKALALVQCAGGRMIWPPAAAPSKVLRHFSFELPPPPPCEAQVLAPCKGARSEAGGPRVKCSQPLGAAQCTREEAPSTPLSLHVRGTQRHAQPSHVGNWCYATHASNRHPSPRARTWQRPQPRREARRGRGSASDWTHRRPKRARAQWACP